MGQVTIKVNGRDYDIACGDGEEKHVAELAAYLDGRVRELAGGKRTVDGDSLVLIMASLIIADELLETQQELKRVSASSKESGKSADALAAGVVALAKRIESVAERLAAP
ncbi:MAG: cell division protein ZapA [Alphaproteobacteria bacterium]|nr:cell division protein ZapA [Alphaproteobacteria bacterium]